MTDKHVDITEKLQNIGETVSEYKDSLMKHFKDMDVEVQSWNFNVGKLEKETTVEVNIKLSIKPKKA
jgi:hypothetical protein